MLNVLHPRNLDLSMHAEHVLIFLWPSHLCTHLSYSNSMIMDPGPFHDGSVALSPQHTSSSPQKGFLIPPLSPLEPSDLISVEFKVTLTLRRHDRLGFRQCQVDVVLRKGRDKPQWCMGTAVAVWLPGTISMVSATLHRG